MALGLAATTLAAAEASLESLSGRPPHPPQNPPTRAKVELGKKLFFDNRLSGPGNRSCGTCHRPELLFSDGLSRAWGLKETELRRRTPTLHNVGWQVRLFHDGRAGSLEEQAAFPLRAEHEMDLAPEEAVARLRRDPEYERLFAGAFPNRELSWDLVAESMASYQRTLVSYDSDLDRYLSGAPDALSEAARRGMTLFTGSAGCAKCHHGPLLSDQKMHYVAVPEMLGDSPQGTAYKTPSLRDAALRGSYMHNGHYRTLDAVLELYQGIGAPGGPPSEAPLLRLTPGAKADLVAFLGSLTGRTYSIDVP